MQHYSIDFENGVEVAVDDGMQHRVLRIHICTEDDGHSGPCLCECGYQWMPMEKMNNEI